MTIDERINSVEVIKNGHVTHLVVQHMDGRAEKYCFPFDSVPPSMIVVNREKLVALLAPKPNLPLTFEQLKERVGKPVYVKTNGTKDKWAILEKVAETVQAEKTTRTVLITTWSSPVSFTDDPKYYDHATED